MGAPPAWDLDTRRIMKLHLVRRKPVASRDGEIYFLPYFGNQSYESLQPAENESGAEEERRASERKSKAGASVELHFIGGARPFILGLLSLSFPVILLCRVGFKTIEHVLLHYSYSAIPTPTFSSC